jgi:hypothetical protein
MSINTYEVRDLGFKTKTFKVSNDIIKHLFFQTGLNEWKLLSNTNRNVQHTVKREGNEFRCSCQDFKINKNSNCKHIRFIRYEIAGGQ